MVVTALIFVTQLDARPSYARDTMLKRGDNMSAFQRVSKCKGERGSVAGVENTIADGISR